MPSPRVNRGASRRARVALAAFLAVAVFLAAAPAVRDSRIVLATSGGSPDWLLGVLRFAGWDELAGDSAGWIYFAALMAACALWAILIWLARDLSMRTVVAAVVGLHAVFFLAPPLLSHDVFSYISYARLGVVHDLNPYTHRPLDIPADGVFPFAGSKHAVNVYGPLFTLASYPLAWLSVPAAFWVLKGVAAASSLGLVEIVRRLARRLGADERRAVVLLGLSPATLVHVVGGAHNEATTMLLLFAGIALALRGSTRARPQSATGGFVTVAASAIKASAVIPLPFMLAASRDRVRLIGGFVAAAVAAVVLALASFGPDALNGLNLISSNQDRTSRYSLPHKTVDVLAAVFGDIDRAETADFVRTLFLLILAAFVTWLLLRAWRRPESWIACAGWATLGVLLATAWLVPWYLLWLLPFAALARSRSLTAATAAFTAYTMLIAIPW